MAYIRVQAASTTTSAVGTVGGVLQLTSTTGMVRHAILAISHASGGWEVEIIRVTDSTHVLARWADTGDRVRNGKTLTDLSSIPNGATVLMPEQWVPDLYSDDVPVSLAIPTRTT